MSDINEVGATAFFIAGIREQEKDREHPLFKDPYAEWFVNDDIRRKVGQVFALLPEGMELVRYRSALFDDIIRREIERGMRQIVILGSGFDMRPHVFEDEGVRFCDVDQPAVLAFKGKVLEGHGMTPCAGIPCNYLEADLPAELAKAGFDIDAPTLIIWEGNTMYLPEDLFAEVQQAAGLHRLQAGALLDNGKAVETRHPFHVQRVLERVGGGGNVLVAGGAVDDAPGEEIEGDPERPYALAQAVEEAVDQGGARLSDGHPPAGAVPVRNHESRGGLSSCDRLRDPPWSGDATTGTPAAGSALHEV